MESASWALFVGLVALGQDGYVSLGPSGKEVAQSSWTPERDFTEGLLVVIWPQPREASKERRRPLGLASGDPSVPRPGGSRGSSPQSALREPLLHQIRPVTFLSHAANSPQ